MGTIEEWRKKFGGFEIPEEAKDYANPLEFAWTFDVPLPVEKVWPYMADTSRFNRALGLNKRTTKEVDGQLVIEEKVGFFTNEWVETPWVWEKYQNMSTLRLHTRGFQILSWGTYQFEKIADGGTRIYVYFGFVPKNTFWRFITFFAVRGFKKRFTKIISGFTDERALNKDFVLSKTENFTVENKALKESASVKLRSVKRVLVNDKKLPKEPVKRLFDFIAKGDNLDLERIRIKPLSWKWNISEEDLLRTCLHSTKMGVLNLTWETICPHCKGTRQSVQSLKDLSDISRCDVCKVDFKTSDPDSVEVVFKVHPSIRVIEKLEYCAAEPIRKEHIVLQQVVKRSRTLKRACHASKGRHRLRAVGSKATLIVDVVPGAANKHLVWDGITDGTAPVTVDTNFQVELSNRAAHNVYFVLEELWWDSRALKPVTLFSLPEFKGMFSEELISPKVQLYLGNQAVLFTDIVGSLAFYEKAGDSKAFIQIKKHFDELSDDVKNYQGVLVKTIGDAVMAAYPSPLQALNSALAMQARFNPTRTDLPIRIRISINFGPIIGVNLNTGIDYFGGTVNFAARLQACAEGGEIAISENIHEELAQSLKHMIVREETFKPKGSQYELKVFVIETYPTVDAFRNLPGPNKASVA